MTSWYQRTAEYARYALERRMESASNCEHSLPRRSPDLVAYDSNTAIEDLGIKKARMSFS